jgi:hypothetical protein
VEEKQQFELWRDDVHPAIVSKVDELHLLGYDRATEDEVWACVLHRLRKEKNFVAKHVFVHAILALSPQQYMTWLTAEAYKQPEDWFQEFEV